MAARFPNKASREKAIVEFVTDVVRQSEHQTLYDRQQWKQNEELFLGKMDWGADRDVEEWRAKLFLQKYAPIVRDAAISLQSMIFERDDFVWFDTFDESARQLVEVRKKLLKYHLEELKFRDRFFEWALCGCVYGHATWRMDVQRMPVWKPEVIVEQSQKADKKILDKIQAEGAKSSLILPNSVEEVEMGLEEAMRRILGADTEALPRRSIKSQKRIETQFNLRVCNPHNNFFDPDAHDLNASDWWAEKMFPKFHQLVPLFDAGILDRDKRDAVMKEAMGINGSSATGVVDSRDSQRWRQRNQLSSPQAFFRDREIIDYYGPFVDRDGDIIEENAHFIIACGKYVVHDGVNSYWNRKSPYFSSVFNRSPFKPTGRGVADGAESTQRLLNELFSMFVDGLKLDIYAPMGVNTNMLVDPTQLDNGIRPNEIIHLFGDGKAEDAFSELPQRSSAAATVFQTLEYLDLSGQKAASVNTMSSNPASRARISAQEISSNNTRRMETINSLGIEIDSTCLQELVERLDQYILQFGFDNTALEQMASKGVLTRAEYEFVSHMPAVDRFIESQKHFKIQVRGFTAALEREKLQRNTSEFLSQVNQFPPEAHRQLQWPNILREVIERYGFKADKWIRQNSPEDIALEENYLLETGRGVAVLPQDQHDVHLIVVYDLLMKAGPMPQIVAHAQGHMMFLQQQGIPIPQPPPEVAQMLGLPEPGDVRQTNSLKAVEADMGRPARPVQQTLQ